MKKCLFFLLAVLCISCEDILDEAPKAVMVENFYNTPKEVESAVLDIYRQVSTYNGFGFLYPCQLESYSDFSEGRGSYNPISQFQGLDATNVSRIGQIWDVFYRGIRGANLVIQNTPDASQLSDEQINRYVAEARFMRAFIYFHIVRNWGKAVIRTEANMLERDVPLSSAEEAYNLIEADLLFAEQNLADQASVPGSPTIWSAKTVLADMHYYRKQYGDAHAKLKEVIDSRKFSLIPVVTVDDFEKLYGADLVTSPEEIFYLKYGRDVGTGWSYMTFTNYQTGPYFNGAGLGGLIMDPNVYTVYNNWDDNDIRKQLWYPWDIGLGPNTLLTRKFIDLQRNGQDAGGNDYPFYRFADVLLQFAEVSCRVNNSITDEALEALNSVRRRGYGETPTAPSDIDFSAGDFANAQQFLDTIAAEQGYETFLEGGKRWLYLKVNEKVKEIIKDGTGKDVLDKHFLWPIPTSETNYNDAIDPVADQNPGY